MRLLQMMPLALTWIPVVCGILSTFLFLGQGGFGRGHLPFDGIIQVLALPFGLLLELLGFLIPVFVLDNDLLRFVWFPSFLNIILFLILDLYLRKTGITGFAAGWARLSLKGTGFKLMLIPIVSTVLALVLAVLQGGFGGGHSAHDFLIGALLLPGLLVWQWLGDMSGSGLILLVLVPLTNLFLWFTAGSLIDRYKQS